MFWVGSTPNYESWIRPCIVTWMLIAIHIFRIEIFLFLWILIVSFLFHKLLLTWNSKFLWKEPYKSLQLGWCLLRNDVIKVGNFLFVWTLIVAIWTIAVDINFKLLVKRAIYEPTITLLIAYWRHQKIWKLLFCLKLIFLLI